MAPPMFELELFLSAFAILFVIIDPPGFMALGADDVQTAGLEYLIVALLPVGFQL